MTKQDWFVSLHHHTTFSFMDGFGQPEEHVARAAELGLGTMAFTEHGNVSSHAAAERAGQKYGVKPLYGCELYTAQVHTRRKFHLGVIAMDQGGYRNLNELVSRTWSEGFYQWPTADGPMLGDHSDGLFCLSGCADSLLSCTLLGGKELGEKRDTYSPGDYEAAKRVALQFRETFGDRYALEVQAFPELQRARTLNPAFEQISRETGIPLVATCDVHYPLADDNEMQKILHAAGRGTGTVAQQEQDWEYGIRLALPPTRKALLRKLRGTGLSRVGADSAIANTVEVASRIKVDLPRSDLLRFPLPEGVASAEELVWQWLRRGWEYRYAENKRLRRHESEYVERMKYEMTLITDKDFIDYFLMVSDAVVFAKEAGIPVGPARGSAAASLVCYLLRITEVDPMAYPNMVFERFIDVTRMDLPDIDLDFADTRRDEVRQHLVRRYGADRVGNIGNFIRYRGKNSVNDVARVHSIPKHKAGRVNDLIIERSGGDSRFDASLQDTFSMFPQAQSVLDEHPELGYAMRLEGNLRGLSVHAAGLVVSNAPITDTCAVYERKSGTGKTARVAQCLAYDKKDAEYLGMLKMDFLGLKTMGMIALCLEYIGMDLADLYRIPLTNKKVLRAFKEGDVVGIFQFEGRATRLVNHDVSPDNFLELADINALSRPGPLFSGTTAQYVEVKHGRAEPLDLHPVVSRITHFTKSQIIYQEQILQLCREVGDFPWTHASAIRKIISQKKGEAAFNTMFEDFVAGAHRLHGIDRELATRIWHYMVTSGTYAFNVAHSISYSMLGFWCMWLKINHPEAFYAAMLRQLGSDKAARAKWPKLMRDAERHGISVEPPSLTRSGVTWTPSGTGVLLGGFSQITGIGEVVAENIVQARNLALDSDNPWEEGDWSRLLEVKGIGKRGVENVVEFVHTHDPFGIYRVQRLLDQFRDGIDGTGDWAPVMQHLPAPTVTSAHLEPDDEISAVVFLGLVKKIEYHDLIEDERARSGKSLEEVEAETDRPELAKSCVLHCEDDGEEDVYVRFSRYIFPEFRRVLQTVKEGKSVILVRAKKRPGFGISLQTIGSSSKMPAKFWVMDSPEFFEPDDTEYDEVE